jgi:hypothetical protein
LFQKSYVKVYIGRFFVLFRIPGYAVAEFFVGNNVHFRAVDKETAVKFVNLSLQLGGMAVTVFIWSKP